MSFGGTRMRRQRRFRVLTFTACAVSGVAGLMIAVAVAGIWQRGSAAAMADDRSGAAAASVIAVMLWCCRWLACLLTGMLTGSAVGYVLDVLLSQRGERKRLRALTGPLQQVRDRQGPAAFQ